jgi:peptidyl-prolyl cis-trans isomerase C
MSRRALIPIFIFCLYLPFLAPGASGQQPQGATPAVQATNAPADPVIAKVAGESITERQVLEAINQLARQRPLTREQMQQKDVLLYKDALETLIGLALLKSEAKEMNIVVDPAKVDESWQAMVKRFPSEGQFKQTLLAQGMTEADLRKKLEDSLLFQKVVDTVVVNPPATTDADAQKFYDGNPQLFQIPEQVHAAHILLKVDAAATPEQKAELKKKLEDMRADLESKKSTFAEAAKVSDDKSNAQKGGDLGFFPRGRMVKPFEDAAFSAEPGTLTGIVETQFGYHLIHVIEKKPAGRRSLEESRKDIVNFLGQKSKSEAIQKHVDGLKEKTKVETLMTAEEWTKRHPAK